MTEPSVCAIMLTANRSAMARQAVECFRRQTYESKRLLIWDTGKTGELNFEPYQKFGLINHELALSREIAPRAIGTLRNEAAKHAYGYDILIHWDDDDYSHPNRISEQVALLQSSGADVVGYREMLFWRTVICGCDLAQDDCPRCGYKSEAWLYANNDRAGYAVGTSLCYWRRTWERKPFEATSRGEDNAFLKGLNLACCSSLPENETFRGMYKYGSVPSDGQPRMIARIHGGIHGGNTSENYAPSILEQSTNWKRVPEWDSHCREVFNAA